MVATPVGNTEMMNIKSITMLNPTSEAMAKPTEGSVVQVLPE